MGPTGAGAGLGAGLLRAIRPLAHGSSDSNKHDLLNKSRILYQLLAALQTFFLLSFFSRSATQRDTRSSCQSICKHPRRIFRPPTFTSTPFYGLDLSSRFLSFFHILAQNRLPSRTTRLITNMPKHAQKTLPAAKKRNRQIATATADASHDGSSEMNDDGTVDLILLSTACLPKKRNQSQSADFPSSYAQMTRLAMPPRT